MKNSCWYRMNNEDKTKKANHDPSYVGSHQITESYILATALLTNSKISGELVQSLWQVTSRISLTLWKGHLDQVFLFM